MRWQVQKVHKLQFLVVDTCDLFIALCCSNFWGYGGQTCVTVPDDDQEEEWEVCMCVCVCVCVSVCVCVCVFAWRKARRVKVQRIPLSPSENERPKNPSLSRYGFNQPPPAHPSFPLSCSWPADQSSKWWWLRPHVWRGAMIWLHKTASS